MDGIIKVSPETLAQTAGEFGTKATTLQGITSDMMQLITGLGSTWGGNAAQAYLNKFTGLQTRMFRMVKEHSEDLQNMATAYSNAEKANEAAAQGLSNNIIS